MSALFSPPVITVVCGVVGALLLWLGKRERLATILMLVTGIGIACGWISGTVTHRLMSAGGWVVEMINRGGTLLLGTSSGLIIAVIVVLAVLLHHHVRSDQGRSLPRWLAPAIGLLLPILCVCAGGAIGQIIHQAGHSVTTAVITTTSGK